MMDALNKIRWELHTKLGAVLDEAIIHAVQSERRYQIVRVAIMDWIFDVFDKHMGVVIVGEVDTSPLEGEELEKAKLLERFKEIANG